MQVRRRIRGLRHDPEGRHHRRVPDRVAREMSMLPAAPGRYDLVIEVAIVRPADPGRHGAPVPAAPRGEHRPVQRRAAERSWSELRRAHLPGAGDGARHGGAVTPGEADGLRRSMAAWKRSGGLEPFEARLKSGMKANGYPARFADALYRQILGFGEYGFPESHRELRAAGLRLLLDQVPSPGGVLRGAAEQPADGLLRAGAARAGCAPPWRRRCGRRTCRRATGTAPSKRVRCGWGCAW